jgi:channel protein (hemolysin III family)
VWCYAYTAIALKSIYFYEMPTSLSLALYLGMGWIGAYPGIALWRRYGRRFMEPLLWGGVAYSIGAVLEFMRWPIVFPGVIQWHEVFHIAVLIGLGFHWAFIYMIADGRLTPAAAPSPRATTPGTKPCPQPAADR